MKKTVTRSLALASVIVLSGCSLTSQDVKTEDVMMEKEDIVVREDDAMMKKEVITQKEVLEKNDSMMPENAMVKVDSNQTAGVYANYSASAVESALSNGKKVVLFFHAPWCPSCKSADTSLSDEKLPADTIVFKTDYDSNVELKRKYGVTYQHTFVSLNSDGTLKEKASGISTAAEIAELF